jgi:hypothetical protein
MSSFAETKSSSTTSGTATAVASTANDTYYRDTVTRPSTIPKDLFAASVRAMNDGVLRNPFIHWDKTQGGNPFSCACDIPRTSNIHECCDCNKKSIKPAQVLEEEKWKQKNAQEDDSHSEDDHMDFVHGCGVTVDWLLAFTFDHDCWERPTWWVNRHIIKEATRNSRCRYMHLPEMKKYARKAKVFASHCWGSKFGDVVMALAHGARADRTVWVDLFAVRQWPGNVGDLRFRDVIGKCDAMIVSCSPVEGLKKFMGARKDRLHYLR